MKHCVICNVDTAEESPLLEGVTNYVCHACQESIVEWKYNEIITSIRIPATLINEAIEMLCNMEWYK